MSVTLRSTIPTFNVEAGLCAGLILNAALTPLLSEFLYGGTAADPITILGSSSPWH